MGAIISYNSHDYKPVMIVPVIASFDSDGHISPLYVRIAGKSHHVNSFWVRSQYSNIMEFSCKLENEGLLTPVLLTYYQNEGIWGIPK